MRSVGRPHSLQLITNRCLEFEVVEEMRLRRQSRQAGIIRRRRTTVRAGHLERKVGAEVERETTDHAQRRDFFHYSDGN